VVLDYTWEVPSLSEGVGHADVARHIGSFSGVFTAQSGQHSASLRTHCWLEITERVNGDGRSRSTTILLAQFHFRPATGDGRGILLKPDAVRAWELRSAPVCPARAGAPAPAISGPQCLYGPDYINMNIAVQKRSRSSAKAALLTLRTEFFNVFNHANFYNPISQFSLDV